MLEKQVVRARYGFTLADMAIAMLIIGILAAVAAPKFVDSIVWFRAEAAVKRVAADLNFARHEAKSSGKSRSVDFVVATNSYTLSGIADLNRASQLYSVNLADTGYPATLVSVDFDGNGSVTFDRYGHPYAGSPLAALTSGSIVVESGNVQGTVVVNPTTGEASVP
ncbi:MAG: Tfp pilus assembly protein FimT/FimU [Pirellulales bacterium]